MRQDIRSVLDILRDLVDEGDSEVMVEREEVGVDVCAGEGEVPKLGIAVGGEAGEAAGQVLELGRMGRLGTFVSVE